MAGPRSLRFLLLVTMAASLPARDAAARKVDRVVVEPTRTSIYVGTVSLTMPAFVRQGTAFESTYDCKVFPYFFSNEHGTLRIEVSDSELETLQRGQPIDFRGGAKNHRDDDRTVEGRATPDSATEGRLKVRVRVSRRIELIFNTRYRLVLSAPSPGASERR